jgi:hypothetical protein
VKLGIPIDPQGDPEAVNEDQNSGVSSQHHAEDGWAGGLLTPDREFIRARSLATPFTSLSEGYTFKESLHSIQGDDSPELFDNYQYSGFKTVGYDNLLVPEVHQAGTPEAASYIAGYWINLEPDQRPTATVYASAEVEFDKTSIDVAGSDEYRIQLAGSVLIDIDILGSLALSRSVTIETFDDTGEIVQDFILNVIDKPTKAGSAEAALEAAMALLEPSPEYPVPSYKKDGIKRADFALEEKWFGGFTTLTTASADVYFASGWFPAGAFWGEHACVQAYLDGRIRANVKLRASTDDGSTPPTTGGGDSVPPVTGGGGSGDGGEEEEGDGRPRGPVTPRPDGPHREDAVPSTGGTDIGLD